MTLHASKKILIFALAGIATYFCACDNENLPNYMKSAGDTDTRTTTLPKGLKNLVVDNNFKVTLVPDTEDYIIIKYGVNLMENVSITANVDNSTVTLADATTGKIVRNNKPVPEAEYHFSNIENIVVHSHSSITSTDSVDIASYTFDERIGALDVVSKAPVVSLTVSDGTGEYTLRGKADSISIKAHYTSIVKAENMQTKAASVENHSTGNVYVTSANKVYAEIHHTGNIYVNNKATTILSNNSGKGKILKTD